MRHGLLSPAAIVERVEHLVGRHCGMIGPSVELFMPSGNPEICAYSSFLCDINGLSQAVQVRSDDGSALAGSGSSVMREHARAKAYCEALERYCNVVFNPAQVVVATRAELGEEAVDLDLFARGSDEEYRHPRNHAVPPSNHSRMRWVQGYSLISGRPQFIPISAVYLGSPYEYPAEAFTVPISTGCALAASYERAAISGICEVIERDALMLTWLQQLPLHRVDYASCTDPDLADRLRRVEHARIEQHFFDATTDLGVTTIYSVQIAPFSPLGILVMAATRCKPVDALIKVMDEAAAARLALEHLIKQPRQFDPHDYRSFTRLTDGAVFYAEPSRRGAFDFLLGRQQYRPLEALPVIAEGDDESTLDELVDRFRQRRLELLVVDVTVPQLREIGLYVVKAIAPQLMPLAVNYNLRFTATPRLYQAPAAMGYSVRSAPDLNPWPQPFA